MDVINDTQDNFSIELTYTGEYDAFNTFWIAYRNPLGRTGVFTSVLHDSVNKKVTYIPPVGSALVQRGKWYFWIGYTTAEGRKHQTDCPYEVMVKQEGVKC